MPTNGHVPKLPRWQFGKHFEVHPVVFPVGAFIVVSLVAACFFVPADELQISLVGVRNWIGDQFGWMYVALLSGFSIFAVWLALGRFGDLRLGRDDEQPEFSRLSWFAMLFSAGMGIGLLFYSVAEPIYHWQSKPPGFADGLDRSRLSMATTIFHWGLHPWATYAVVGLVLAFFGFRRDMPLSFRSVLYPLLGNRVWGRTGDAIDTLAIIATLMGVATSLGIGAQQVNAGLSFLFGIGSGTGTQICLITGITFVATVSVVLGLDAGIRRLSELNIGLAICLMAVVVAGSGFTEFLGASVENFGAYAQVLPFNSFRTGAFNSESRSWLNEWTIFYWAWWISWSPFVGMFIARVSRGRTIREFIMGVVLVPTAVGLIWLTAFGTTTLRLHTDHYDRVARGEPTEPLRQYWVGKVSDSGDLVVREDGTFVREEQSLTAVDYLIAPIVTADGTTQIDTLPTVLFVLLDSLFRSPLLVKLAVGIATLCIVLFFVTSSDSASMVIDIIASGGNPNPPVGTRLFWAVTEGLVAAALLMAGGLQALQAASIAAALPFSLVLLMSCFSFVRALHEEEVVKNGLQSEEKFS